MTNFYFCIVSLSALGLVGISFGYWKVFGIRRYKVLKEYIYKESKVQLIKNPQNNVCGICYDILEEHDEIGRFPECDHHFCQKCIHKQIDESHSNLKKRKPCAMCMDNIDNLV